MSMRDLAAAPNDAEALFNKLFLTAEGRRQPYPLYDQLPGDPPCTEPTWMRVLTRYEIAGPPCATRASARTTPGRSSSAGPDWRRHPSLTAASTRC